ncbi:MAG: hypothetical protein P4L50_05635 [Anaerolineaceae bacterium]|nr:hypothetical protein [Anaerolineaceae bacterium]
MNSTFNGVKMLLLIPFIVIVFFVFSRLQTTQALSSRPAEIAAPVYTETSVVTAAPVFTETSAVAAAPIDGSYLLPLDAPTATLTAANLPLLQDFIRQVADGNASDIDGLYIQGIAALKVVQQPAGNPAYIDLNDGTATQFQSANVFAAVGLLAHNFLAGRNFFHITTGQDLILINGDGSTQHYLVANIADYQRLTPSDLRSNFRELASNQQLTADQLFGKFYKQSHHLILQTCIENGGNPDWGVRFIDGEPVQ